LYAIYVWPPMDHPYTGSNFSYVQAAGTLGGYPVWRTKAEWGTTTIQGLTSNTTYSVKVRAFNGVAGVCPSEPRWIVRSTAWLTAS